MRARAAQEILPGIVKRRPVYAPVVREPILHKQIADAFRLEIAAPLRISRLGVVWYSVDIAAYSGNVPGIRTGRGVVAGVADINIFYQGLAHFLELKAYDGQLSVAQADGATALLHAGCRYGIASSVEEALACLDAWEIPRRGAMRI